MTSVEEKEREREYKSVVLLLQGIMKSAACGYKGGVSMTRGCVTRSFLWYT